MNEFDKFVKHKLKVKRYMRHADDFVLLSNDKGWLERQLSYMRDFLCNNLRLSLHPNKVFIKTVASGVDFLGWVHFSDHRILRATTKRRMLKKLESNGGSLEALQSYLGLLSHGNTRKLSKFINLLYPV